MARTSGFVSRHVLAKTADNMSRTYGKLISCGLTHTGRVHLPHCPHWSLTTWHIALVKLLWFFAPVLKAESFVRPSLVKTGGFVLLEFIVPVARRTCDTVRMGYTKTPMCHGDLEHGLTDYAPVHV